MCRLFVDQAAGNGDYVGYVTVQRAGAGSSYVMLPKTTATAASGETAIGLVSIGLPVSTGDVVTAYIDGLAGDTTTPDVACEWFEVDTLRPTTADRTLDVSATGEAGIDWANVGSPTTAVNLSATNIDVDQVVASVSGAVGSVSGAVGSVTGNVGGNVAGSVGSVTGSVGSVAAGGITASSIATGAVDANALAADAVAEIQSGLATAAKLLSYIQSIARNDVTVDSDIGGTYDDATDSLQAIRDRGDAAWVSGSSTALLTGTASAGAAGSITLAGGTATDDIYNYAVVSITSGTGAGQTRVINDYVGSTKVATIAPDWAVTPDNTSVFRVDPFPSVWSAVTRTLTGANAVTFNGPVLTSGNVQIVEGDDYHETEGLNLSWAWTDATASYTSATATFYAERPGGADFSKALYSVTKAGSTVTGLMRLTAAESALLTTGAPWSFQIRVTFSSGRVSTKVRGSTDVIARIGT